MGMRAKELVGNVIFSLLLLLLPLMNVAAATSSVNGDMERRKCIAELQEEYRKVIGESVVGRHVYLVDMVYHWNIGDSLIEYGEQLFLKESGTPNDIFCSMKHCNYKKILKEMEQHPKTSTIAVHGGGNFGDIWLQHGVHHRKLLRRFYNYSIVFLPQTVVFRKAETAKSLAAEFSKHPRVRLIARDLESLSTFQNYFPDIPSALAPDAAFMIGPIDASCAPTHDVLIIARKDQENPGTRRVGEMEDALAALQAHNLTYLIRDWPCGHKQASLMAHSVDASQKRAGIGIKCLCQGRVLVTNRLHGTILATLMGIPHVFMDSRFRKLSRFQAAHFASRPACSSENIKSVPVKSWMEAANGAIDLFRKTFREE